MNFDGQNRLLKKNWYFFADSAFFISCHQILTRKFAKTLVLHRQIVASIMKMICRARIFSDRHDKSQCAAYRNEPPSGVHRFIELMIYVTDVVGLILLRINIK